MALRRAVENGNVEELKELLNNKRNDIHQRLVGGYTVLHYAATVGVAKLLVNANADPEAKSFAGTTPLQLAQRRGNDAVVQYLRSVELPDSIRKERVEVKRQAAENDLRVALANRGVVGASMLESLPEEVNYEFRTDERLRTLFVKACAIQDFESLMGERQAASLSMNQKLVAYISEDNISEVQLAIFDGADLLQRDHHGNTPAHFCISLLCFKVLVEKKPQVAKIRNKEGQTPLDLLMERCAGPEVVAELWYGGPLCEKCPMERVVGDPVGLHNVPEIAEIPQTVLQLVQLDDNGVSHCMRYAKLFEPYMKPWADFQQNFKIMDRLPENLATDAGVLWKEHLAYQLFGEPEVWKDGKMSAQCAERLVDIWALLKTMLKRIGARTNEEEAVKAMQTVRGILKATQGPRKLDDARESYRGDLDLEMQKLAAQSEAILDILNGMMQGDAATWLKSFPDSNSWKRLDPFGVLKPDPDQQSRAKPKLRFDFARVEDASSSLTVPSWVHGDIDIAKVLQDLRRVGGKDLHNCFGDAISNGDAAYRILETRFGFGAESFPMELADFCDPSIIFWYTAWLRGLCQGRQESIAKTLCQILVDLEPSLVQARSADSREGSFFVQTEAKPMSQACKEVMEEIQAIYDEHCGSLLSEDVAKRLMLDAPAFVLDYNAVTLVLEDAVGIMQAFKSLQSSSGGILRVANSYHKKAPSEEGFRDLQLWVPIRTDRNRSLIVQVSLVDADFHRERFWQKLSYDYFKGDFDHTKPDKPQDSMVVQLPPALVPQPKLVIPDGADEETERKMREMMERRAREDAERQAQEAARKKREEVERKLREEMPDFDPADCEVRGNVTFRPPIEVLPATRRTEKIQMEKVEKWNQKKAQNS